MTQKIINQIINAIRTLPADSDQSSIKNSLTSIDFKIEENQKEKLNKLFGGLAKKLVSRKGTPKQAFEDLIKYQPNWIVDFFLTVLELFGYPTERSIIGRIEYLAANQVAPEPPAPPITREEVAPEPPAPPITRAEILANLKKHLIKDRLFEIVENPQKINNSYNQSGKAKKGSPDGNPVQRKHQSIWYFKQYQQNKFISAADKTRIEVLANEMLREVLGQENTTKYRVGKINEVEHVISKECGNQTLGQYLNLQKPNEYYYDKFMDKIKDPKLLKSFIKLNLTCIYLLRDFDLHPFNIMLKFDDNNNITGFIPIDFGATLQAKHLANEGINPFKRFLQQLNNQELVKECMVEVKDLIFGKQKELEAHRDLCAEALDLSQDMHERVKDIWTNFTSKLETDYKQGDISL